MDAFSYCSAAQGNKGKEKVECSSSAAMEGFKHYRPSSEKLDPSKRYHVFLSFRGPDVRDNLANKLYKSLQDGGLQVFLDSEKLEKGENIGVSLEEAIKDSRLHIPIFSRGYASSAWCLKELSLMWSCKGTRGSKIIPLFYDVEPWQVRYPDNEKSPYAEALKKHSDSQRQSTDEIDGWKKALYEVSSLSGWALADTASGDEDKLVQKVTEDLQSIIGDLYVAKHPMGLDARTDEVMQELLGNTDNQRGITMGIWGMGGSGKTTLLKSIFNRIHHSFQACSYVADIRAIAKESAMGLRKLQKRVLKDLTKHDVDLCSVAQGKIEMQNRLTSIKSLVLLDDVDDDEQLDALLGDSYEVYGPGSVIIITTRDKNVLQRRQNDKMKIRAMRVLSPEEGLKLFSLHAFERESPEKSYEDMTEQIVCACDGLPLSLEFLGAHLRHEREHIIWKEALEKIQNVGYNKLYKSLKISYDALTSDEKEIFLDIACFFVSYRYKRFSKEFYIKFWNELKRKTVHTSIKNLGKKSLIVINNYKYSWKFGMHDHLRDLGRQIVEEQSIHIPHMRNRLWRKEDIISVIAQAEKTSNVQGITWSDWCGSEVEQLDSLASINNLKFMFFWDLILKRKITKLPQNLRYLVFSNYTVEQHTSSSEMPASTETYGSCLFLMPNAIGQLKYLRYLDMRGTSLGRLPNKFGELLSLEELYLPECSLIELPHSFGNLIKLKILDISLNELKSFPANFSQLRSLEYLYAGQNEFEESPTLPEGLVHLDLSYSEFLQKLSAISHITNLHTINLSQCLNLKELPVLPRSLTPLSLAGCHNLQRMSCMSHMENLKCISLCECPSLGELPELEALHSLTELTLNGCENLKELPVLPRSLTSLSLAGCHNLQRMSCMSHMENLNCIFLSECRSLGELPELEPLHSLTELNLKGCWNLEELPLLPRGLIYLTLEGCNQMQRMSCMRHMENLKHILLSQCRSLGEVPELEDLHLLTKLNLDGCENLKELAVLPKSLTSLNIAGCHNLQRMSCMSHMENLKCIFLSECRSLSELPELEALYSLTELNLSFCENIKDLPILPRNLTSLTLRNIPHLQKLPCISHMGNLKTLNLSGCRSLTTIPELDSMHSLRQLILDFCCGLEKWPALPEGPIDFSKLGVKLQNAPRKSPASECYNETPVLDLLGGITSEVSEGATSAAQEQIIDCRLTLSSSGTNDLKRRRVSEMSTLGGIT